MLMLGSVTVWILAIAFALVCLFMMLVILIQKPKGGGLSGAFGGAGGSADAAFGSKTGDVLTVITVSCFVLFLVLAMGLQWTIRPEARAAAAALQREAAGQVDDADPAVPEGSAASVLSDELEEDARTDTDVDAPPVGDNVPNDAIFDDIQRGISDVRQEVQEPIDEAAGPVQPEPVTTPQQPAGE
jgi:preprotein translocase subunit SecG